MPVHLSEDRSNPPSVYESNPFKINTCKTASKQMTLTGEYAFDKVRKGWQEMKHRDRASLMGVQYCESAGHYYV